MEPSVTPRIIAEKLAAKADEKKRMGEALKECPPIGIADRLKTYPFRFIKVTEFDKIPIDKEWQLAGSPTNYSYDDPKLLKHLESGGNYGICCGMGNLLVIDIDNVDRVRELGILDKLPKTFKVRTRSGGLHLLCICKDFEKKKIMYDPERTWFNPKTKKEEYVHLGELQWLGAQVVGPSSRFRLDDENKVFVKIQRWEVEDDVPLAEVKQADILKILDEAGVRPSALVKVKEEPATVALPVALPDKTPARLNPAWGFVDNIRLVDIALPVPIKSDDRGRTGEIQGGHPIHGSDKESGKENNYAINVKKNSWCCYRCVPEGGDKQHSGGGPLEYLAVEAGIIDCSEATTGCLKVKGRMKAVLDYARGKGLPVPDNAYLTAKKAGEKKSGLIKYICETLTGLINFKVLVDDSIVIYDPETGCYQYNQANPRAGEQEIVALCREIGGDGVDNHICSEVLGWAKGRRRVNIKDFDDIEGLIVVQNGILDMKTGKLSEFTPDFLSLCPCPTAWKGMEVDTSVIDGYMEWCHPQDKETQDYHWRRFGSLVAGTKGDQTMDLWYSPEGDSGKSTWMLLLQAIAGKQAIWRPPIELFSPGKGGYKGNKQFSLAETEHRKALMASEPSEQTSYLDDQMVKVTTGDPIAGRNPWGLREREIVHDGATILATNPMLKVPGGVSPPIKRRLRISRWDNKVGDKTIKHYEQMLITTGGPGILRRLVEGYQAYLTKGLKPSPAMEEWLMEFIVYNDPLYGFVGEVLTPAARGESLSFIEIHKAWELFLKVSGFAGSSEDEKKLKLKEYFGRVIQKQMAQKGWKFTTGRGTEHRGPMMYYGVAFTKTYWDLVAEDHIKVKAYTEAFDQGKVIT